MLSCEALSVEKHPEGKRRTGTFFLHQEDGCLDLFSDGDLNPARTADLRHRATTTCRAFPDVVFYLNQDGVDFFLVLSEGRKEVRLAAQFGRDPIPVQFASSPELPLLDGGPTVHRHLTVAFLDKPTVAEALDSLVREELE